MNMPSIVRWRQHNAGSPNRKAHAKVAPPPLYQEPRLRFGSNRVALVGAAVRCERRRNPARVAATLGSSMALRYPAKMIPGNDWQAAWHR
jgi:hypothetical protein